MKVKTSVCLAIFTMIAGLTLGDSPASAGAHYTVEVNITINSYQKRASGAFRSVAASADDVQDIGCEVDSFNFIQCVAVNSQGQTLSCFSVRGAGSQAVAYQHLLEVLPTITERSFLSFVVGSDGSCSELTVDNFASE